MVTLTPWHVRDARFGLARHGELGYDDAEVDAFLERVEATLTGQDVLTAEDVQAIRFTEHRHRGYPAVAVDTFLGEVAETLAGSTWISGHTPTPDNDRSPSRSSRGISASPPSSRQPTSQDGLAADLTDLLNGELAFDDEEVDAYLDRIKATLAGEDTLSSHDVLTATFSPPPPGRPGYSQSGVQAFLVVAATSLDKLGSRTGAARAEPIRPTSPPSRPATKPLTEDSAPAPRRLVAPPSLSRHRSPAPSWGVLPFGEPGVPPRPEPGETHSAVNRPGAKPTPYDKDEVDAFLNRIRATLLGRDTVSAQDVLAAEFDPPPPGQNGYSETEFIALVAKIL